MLAIGGGGFGPPKAIAPASAPTNSAVITTTVLTAAEDVVFMGSDVRVQPPEGGRLARRVGLRHGTRRCYLAVQRSRMTSGSFQNLLERGHRGPLRSGHAADRRDGDRTQCVRLSRAETASPAGPARSGGCSGRAAKGRKSRRRARCRPNGSARRGRRRATCRPAGRSPFGPRG